MGRVFRARRADGSFEREVAIKVLRWELASDSARRRFDAERHILAQLEHPNIARLLDGGFTDDEVPYLVLELVDGRPLDEACRELDLRARIELFLQVCEAVQFAHQKLVIHRDLKPSNVLVDGDGRVHLLDFGVAKLIGVGDTGGQLTATGMLSPHTLAYASPEQLRGDPVGTPTDVFSLGALLFRILAGAPAFDIDGGVVPPDDPRIAERTMPSLAAAARRRGSASRELRGDLERIVAKALAVDPAERYGWAGELAEDLRLYLHGLPILARAPSASYRLRKFVRRHRWPVAFATVAALALLAATAVSLRWARVAEQRQAAAESLSGFAMDVLRLGDPDLARSDELTARALLEGSVDGAGEIADLGQRARVLEVIAEGLANLQVHQRAGELYEAAAALHSESGAPRERALEALLAAGTVYGSGGLLDEAERLLEAAHRGFVDLAGGETVESARAQRTLAFAFTRHTPPSDPRFQRAEELFATALTTLERLVPEGNDDTATILHYRGSRQFEAYLNGGQEDERLFAGALADLETALEMRRQIHGDRSAPVADSLNGLGLVLDAAGQTAESLPLIEEAYRILESLHGPLHPDVVVAQTNLGMFYRDLDRPADAVRTFESVLDLEGRVSGTNLRFTTARKGLADSYLAAGELDRAEPLYRRVLEELGPDARVHRWLTQTKLGELLIAAGRPTEAIADLSEAADGLAEALGERDARAVEAARLLSVARR